MYNILTQLYQLYKGKMAEAATAEATTQVAVKESGQGMFISETLKNAWELFKKEWITIYAINAVSIAVAIIYSVLTSSMEESSVKWMFDIAYMLVQVVVGMGIVNAYLSVVRGQKVTIETFTATAPKILKYVLAQIILGIIVFLGLLFFIVPGIIFAIKFMFTLYLVVDEGLGPIEALKASEKLTQGRKWDMMGFMLVAAVLAYSGILALFVGLIVTIPVATLSYAVLYNSLVKKK